jgi:hypothetical protein
MDEAYELDANAAFLRLAEISRPGTRERLKDVAPALIEKSVTDCVELMRISA